VGVYVQDTWTIRRLTLSPACASSGSTARSRRSRWPPGGFVPARTFDAIPDVPNWKSWAPRLGVAYDVFGDAKMAIKGSAGKYMQQEGTGFATPTTRWWRRWTRGTGPT
jgi:hypothetical protein